MQSFLFRVLRIGVGIAAALLVAWAFYHVIERTFFRRQVEPGQTLLTVVHWGDNDEDAIVRTLVSEFMRENPDIRVRRVNPGAAAAVNTKVQTMFASGDPPDVLQLGYEKVADWSGQDLLMPLEEWIERDARDGEADALRLEDFYPQVIDCFRYDGTQVGRGTLYGIAKDFSTAGFYYNKDLFRRAGLPFPADDWTWDDFIRSARAIARLDGCYGAEFVTWEAMIRIYVWTENAEFADEGFREFRLDDPRLLSALDRLRGWFHDREERRTFFSAKTQLETGEDLFLSGRVGMSGPLGRWKVPTFRLIRGFDWEFAPLPRGAVAANGVFTSAWAIARGTRHPEESWRLLRFLSSRRGQELSCGPGLAIPSMRSVAEGPLFLDPGKKPERDDLYLAMVPAARTFNWPADPRYLHSLRITTEELFKTGELTASRALQRVKREWTRIQADQPVTVTMRWDRVALGVLVPLLGGLAIVAAIWWRRRPTRMAFREELAGLATISPWLIGFVVFTAFPIVLSLLLAFCQWSGMATIDKARWSGLANIAAVLRDDTFRTSLRITTWYVMLAVPLGQLAALAAATLMSLEIRGIGFFRSAWYLPSVLAGVGVAVLWKFVFDDEVGLLNSALAPIYRGLTGAAGLVGLEWPAWRNIGWLEKDAVTWGVPAFVIISLWSLGGSMMIYLAGLKGIPTELYEAASIDGAVAWRRFTHVTLPMLSPVIFFNFVIGIISAFQVFTQAYVMTGGGPGDATRFYVMWLYNQAFDNHQMGFASAMAWMLLLIVLALTLLVMWGSRRLVYYEALKA